MDRVGHERDNATAEVRRSFDPAAGYNALYQAAYLLGGLQIRGLRKELVDSKQMTNTRFHDEILRQGSMPIALLRLAVNTKIPLTRDMNMDWKFYGELAQVATKTCRCATMCYMVPVRMPSPTPPVKRASPRPRVGVRELRQNLSVYLERVMAGERFDVTDRGQVVAMLIPSAPAATLLDRLIADGRAIRPAQERASLDAAPPVKVDRRRTAAHLGSVRGHARRPAMSFLPVYVDSSALLKLVLPEPERPELERVLARWPDRISSVILAIECQRIATRAGVSKGLRSRLDGELETVALIRLDEPVQRLAGSIGPRDLRSLDAIHLATALSCGDYPEAFITYDDRLAAAARTLNLNVLQGADRISFSSETVRLLASASPFCRARTPSIRRAAHGRPGSEGMARFHADFKTHRMTPVSVKPRATSAAPLSSS